MPHRSEAQEREHDECCLNRFCQLLKRQQNRERARQNESHEFRMDMFLTVEGVLEE